MWRCHTWPSEFENIIRLFTTLQLQSADEDRETSLKALQKLESAHRMKTFVTKLIQKSGSL